MKKLKKNKMKEVICINDKNLPGGAVVVKGREYTVIEEFLNNYDQRVYIIEGIVNQGTTKMGLRWIGYDASRFVEPEKLTIENYEHAYAEN
jgi:hypothetical protein